MDPSAARFKARNGGPDLRVQVMEEIVRSPVAHYGRGSPQYLHVD